VKNAHEPSAEDIQALVDGELSPEQATQVRAALAANPRALAELDECMQLAALAHALRQEDTAKHRWIDIARFGIASGSVPDAGPPARPRRRRPRLFIALGASLSLAGSAAALVLWMMGGEGGGRGPSAASTEGAFASALGPRRSIEARLSWPAADRHRTYDVMRAAGAQPTDRLSFDLLSRIEKLGDPRALTAAQILSGNAAQAEPMIAGQHSPDADSDRAAIALAQGKPETAVLAAGAALASNPHHVQATWNRALALQHLGMPLTAAEAFEVVASRHEAGWSEEASERASALRAGFQRRQGGWRDARTAGDRLVATGMVDEPILAAYPGLMRRYFYDAVRTAASSERVRALRPLAAALDARFGGQYLARYVDRVSRADFGRRGPLAARYAALVRGELTDASNVEALLGALRAARQDDLVLGALPRTGPGASRPTRAHLNEYVALAHAARDPWFELDAEANRAWWALWGEDFALAQSTLLAVAPRCDGATAIDYQCLDVFRLLTHAYTSLHRPEAAARALERAWAFARLSGNVARETELLHYAFMVAELRDDTSASLIDLSIAYLDELMRESDDCADQSAAHEWKAIALVTRNRVDDARRELERDTGACIVPFTSDRAYLQADLLRHGGSDPAVRALRREIEGLRGKPGGASPGELAFLDYVEGLLLVERVPTEGRALLRRAIAAARDLPGDMKAVKARQYSYSALIEDAATRDASAEALGLLAEQRGLPAPTRCALGAQSELTSTVFVARASDGTAMGARFTRAPGAPSGTQEVPDAMRAAFAGCESIDVLAGQPYYGRPELLPRDMAWAFRTGTPVRASATGTGRRMQVVVANIAPPPGLGLAPLRPIADAPGATLLEGPAATPARVLAAAASASLIEIHAHGLLARDNAPSTDGQEEGTDAADADTSLLVLAPGSDGGYALGGREIRRTRLRGAPVVVLAACHASATGSAFHSTWGLADAFMKAGARAVIASPDPIDDGDAAAFFAALRARLAAGEDAAAALRAERVARRDPRERGWIDRLVVFR
jgi:cellulose synthase operon protein C